MAECSPVCWCVWAALEGLCVLAQDVADEQVGQTACADAEEALLDVVLAKDFAYHGVEVYGFGCGFDATGSLEAYKRACEVVIFLDGGAHHVGCLERGSDLYFARRGLYKVGTGVHGEYCGALDVDGRLEGTRFEYDLEGLVGTGGFYLFNLVGTGFVVAAEEGAHVEHTVALVGSVVYGKGSLGGLDFDECL